VARKSDDSIVDPEGFERAFTANFRTIHQFLSRRAGSAVADDLTAETFAIAFRRRRSFDPERGALLPWLYGIAANLIGKHSRAEVRMLRAYARTGADPVLMETQTDEADGRLASAAVRQDLAAALAALTNGDRDVLLMIAWADLSYTEVATALGIPVGTVRSRLHRARARIRAALGGDDPTSVREESLP